MKHLILGGVRSGKSRYAEQQAGASGKAVVYFATAQARDAEMARRIAWHRRQRPAHWLLVEEPLALADALEKHASPEHCLLVDCLTLWLSNLLHAGEERLQRERQALLDCLPRLPGEVLLVTNEVGQGIVPMGELNRRFCDEAGRLHQALAARCERVTWMIAGLPQCVKGEAV